MKLLPKLTLLSLGVSAIPLGIAGYSSARIGQNALRAAIEEHELTTARQVAEYVAGHIGYLTDTLHTDARIFDLMRGAGESAPTPVGTLKFLQFVYHQSDDFAAVAMLDDHGEPVGEAAYVQNPAEYDAFKRHEGMRPADVESLRLLAPIGDAMTRGEGVGPVFLGGPTRTPHVVLAVAFDPRLGGGKRVLCAEVSLRALAEHVAAVSTVRSDDAGGRPAGRDVRLLDARGRVVASGSAGGAAALDVHRVPNAPEDALPPREQVAQYESDGRAVVGAYAPAGAQPFGVVVEQAVEAAMLPVDRMRWATMFWIGVSGLVAALVAGALARSLSGRVGALAAGSREITQGKLDTRLEVASDDELGDLASTFNAMATSLDAARVEILRQNDEIKSWNEDLERRVEEKTRELRQAQDLLLRSRSLAAVGELGAGVAHEINNPLTGVLGLAQLLLVELPGDHPAHALVQDIEGQALRIRHIVSNLLRLAQRQAGEDFRPVDLRRVAEDALDLCGPTDLAAAGIEVVRRWAEALPPVRGSGTQLQEAIIQLIQNARGAMPQGGRLTLETSVPDPTIARLTVADTGRGIAPEHLPRIFDPFFTTKSAWTGTGMGLSVVHKIVEDHGGTIRVDSEVGKGTTFTLTFPADAGGLHLA